MSGRPTKYFKNPPLTSEEIRELSEFDCDKAKLPDIQEKSKKLKYLTKSAKSKPVLCNEIKSMIQNPPRPDYPNSKSGPTYYNTETVKENCEEATKSAGVSSSECKKDKLKAYEAVFKLINPTKEFVCKGGEGSVCNESVSEEPVPAGPEPVAAVVAAAVAAEEQKEATPPAAVVEEVYTSPPAAGDVNWIKLRIRKTEQEMEEYEEDEFKIKELLYPSTEYPTVESALNEAFTLIRRGNAMYLDSTEERVRKVLSSISSYPSNAIEAKFKQLMDIIKTPYSNVASILASQKWTLQNIEKLSELSKQKFRQIVQAESNTPSDIFDKISEIVSPIPESIDVQEIQTTELFTLTTEMYTRDIEEEDEKGDFTPQEIETYKDAIDRNDPAAIVSFGTVQEYDDNFMKMTIEPDGNCMFYCMAGHLNAIHYGGKTNWTQCMVRRFIRKYMEREEFTDELYQLLFEGMTKAEYRRHLADGCVVTDQRITYGTALDALAFSIASGITVCIVSDFLKNIDGSDGNVLFYHDTRPDEIYGVAFSQQYDAAHVMPIHTYQPLYMKQQGAHYDLLIRKRTATEYLLGEFVPSLHTKYYPSTTHPYIPFPFMTLDYFYREIRSKRNKYMQQLREQPYSPLAIDGSPFAPSSSGSPRGSPRGSLSGSPFAPPAALIAPRPSFPLSLFRQEKPISIEETHAKTVKVPSAPEGMFRVGDYRETLDRILRCI